MAILRVQGNARGTSSTSTISVTMASTPISGNVLVAVVGTTTSSGGYVTSIAQTGVTWTRQIAKSLTYQDCEIWLGVVGSGASKTITVTLSATPLGGAVADVCEYSGIASNALDKTATSSGTSTYPATGTTETTTQAVELWVGGTMVDNNSVQSSPTNGFTLLDGATYSYISVGFLEKIVSAIGTASSSTTISTSRAWAGCIATFKGVAGTSYSKTVSEVLGLVDGKSSKTAFHKTTSEVLGLVDDYDKNRCKKCKPSVTLTF